MTPATLSNVERIKGCGRRKSLYLELLKSHTNTWKEILPDRSETVFTKHDENCNYFICFVYFSNIQCYICNSSHIGFKPSLYKWRSAERLHKPWTYQYLFLPFKFSVLLQPHETSQYIPGLFLLSLSTNTHNILKVVCFHLQVKTLIQPITD
jgi:hypothetical protein